MNGNPNTGIAPATRVSNPAAGGILGGGGGNGGQSGGQLSSASVGSIPSGFGNSFVNGGTVYGSPSPGGQPQPVATSSQMDSAFSGGIPSTIDAASKLMQAHPWIAAIIGTVVPGAGLLESVIKLAHWWMHRNDKQAPAKTGGGGNEPTGGPATSDRLGSQWSNTPIDNVSENQSQGWTNGMGGSMYGEIGQGTTNGRDIQWSDPAGGGAGGATPGLLGHWDSASAQ